MSFAFFITKYIVTKYIDRLTKQVTPLYCLLLLSGCFLLATGCSPILSGKAQSNSRSTRQVQISPSVDVAVARQDSLKTEIKYVGTTFPLQEVSLRSRIEGQILELNADIGDRVAKGQILGRIDDSLNTASVLEAEAELEALRSEVTSLQADVSEGLTQVKQAKIVLQQAESDLVRSNYLIEEGAITRQSSEQAQNDVDNAKQVLESAQQQIANRNSSVVAAQRRVAAQEALVAQERQRKSFTILLSPVTGSVMSRVLEPGDLAQVGDEVLQLGDFSQIKVQAQISELELSKIRIGQKAQVKLDSLPGQTFTGKVTQISLAADATARLVPVEVTIPNLDDRIGRGLLARVSFIQRNQASIVIPESAIRASRRQTQEIGDDSVERATIFVLQEEDEQAKVSAREVKIGDRADSQVEILSGLTIGEKVVIRSSGNLKDGDRVRRSFLSEP